MAIISPTQLVDEFKKSGEFDRLRRELLAQFQRSDSTAAASFTTRVEDIARQKLLSDQKLQDMPPDAAHRELMKEMDRYPIVERAVGDFQMFSDPSFVTGIRNSVQKILKEDRAKAVPPSNPDEEKPPLEMTSQLADSTNHGVAPGPSVIAPAEVAVSNTVLVPAAAGSSTQSHGSTADSTSPITTSDEKGTVGPLSTSNDPRAPPRHN